MTVGAEGRLREYETLIVAGVLLLLLSQKRRLLVLLAKRTLLLHHPRMLAVNIASLDSLAFVVAFFAFSESDHEFDVASSCQKFSRNDSLASVFLLG